MFLCRRLRLADLSSFLYTDFKRLVASSLFLSFIAAKKDFIVFLRSVLISRLCICLLRFFLSSVIPAFL